MGGISTLLGRDELVVEISALLTDDPESFPVIQGPAGAGKSWLAQTVGAVVEQEGGVTLVAAGDRLHSDRPLYPLGYALAPLAPTWRAVGRELIQVGSTGERLVGSTGVVTALIATMASLGPNHRKARKLLLAKEERDVLVDLESLSDGRPILLVADNLHWWDPQSLGLLARLREPRMRESFEVLSRLRIIGVHTPPPHQRVSHPEAHQELLRRTGITRFELKRPEPDIFPAVLRSMGMDRERAEAEANAILGVTGGHLALVDRYARYRSDGEPATAAGAFEDAAFMRRLLDDRLHALGSNGETIVTVLRIAAVLGLTFKRSELLCAFDGPPEKCLQLLRACRDEQLLDVSDTVGRFAHEVFRQHFLDVPVSESAAVHQTVANCLRVLRPGDYPMRAFHMARGEQPGEAATLAALAALRMTREGADAGALRADARELLSSGPHAAAARRLCAAQTGLSAYEYPAVFAALDELPHGLPRPLAAEAAILRGAALIATRNEHERAEAIRVLRAWDNYIDHEFDIGLRVLQQLLYALALDVDKTESHKLAERLSRLLNERAEFDVEATDALYVLDRCAGALYEPEVSFRKVRRATEHFEARTNGGLMRNPLELYRCLVNLGAKQVTNARYADALATHERIEQLVAEYTEGTFPRLDFPRSTDLLAQLRAGRISATQATQLQERVVAQDGSRDDPFYPGNALAVYRVLAGDADRGIEEFDALIEKLDGRDKPAPSLNYLLRANRLAAQFVAGDSGVADAWDELRPVLESVPYPIVRYMLKRHELISETLHTADTSLSADEFDRIALGRVRFGPFWDQLGRGFRLPEMEWWH